MEPTNPVYKEITSQTQKLKQQEAKLTQEKQQLLKKLKENEKSQRALEKVLPNLVGALSKCIKRVRRDDHNVTYCPSGKASLLDLASVVQESLGVPAEPCVLKADLSYPVYVKENPVSLFGFPLWLTEGPSSKTKMVTKRVSQSIVMVDRGRKSSPLKAPPAQAIEINLGNIFLDGLKNPSQSGLNQENVLRAMRMSMLSQRGQKTPQRND